VTRRRRGFTLPEMIIATTLLSVGMLSVASLMGASHRQQRLAASRAGLVTLAEGKLEELRSYAAAADGSTLRTRLDVGGSLTANAAGYADSVRAPNGKWYYRRWQLENDPLGARRLTLRLVVKTPAPYDVRTLDFSTLVYLP
jgi:prepilin-type N-terminal cleavage/methylation domain-containing protein